MAKKACITAALIAALLLSACTATTDAPIQMDIQKKLDALDAYKSDIPRAAGIALKEFAFGSTMEQVRQSETLVFAGKNSSTLSYHADGDFEGMVLTYFFDETDRLVLAEYTMKSASFLPETERLRDLLTSLYGVPVYGGYFDYQDHQELEPTAQTEQLIRQEQAYYFALFQTPSGNPIEMIAFFMPDDGFAFSICHYDAQDASNF